MTPENANLERCPGCGNVIVRDKNGDVSGRNFCWPIGVDPNKHGFSYLKDTWGYCRTLCRHYGTREPVWLDKIIYEAAEDGYQNGYTSGYGDAEEKFND